MVALNMDYKNSRRYSIPGDEDFEPNSNNEVIRNFLGVKSKEDIEILEERELERTELELLEIFHKDHQFTAEDICNIHELWLGDLYPFAGKYRSVNMAKDNFMFAPSSRIESLMAKLEKEFLAKFTPCHFSDVNELAYALAVVHVELILIHPFREGNGRLARLLADMMAVQANRPPINYSIIDQTNHPEGFERYILTIHAGLIGDYQPIRELFKMMLDESV